MAIAEAEPHSCERASILLVDDRPESLVSLETALDGLDADFVKVTSGRDALRQVLRREFAAILLDVHMPLMDGFETAALIRQRKQSERTPILFITAYGEDTHVARGYSLGAVDYIVSPVVPEVLRTKVSVFVDLFNTAQQLRLQARALERRTEQLQRLTEASRAINSASSSDEILRAAAAAAADIVGAGRAVGAMVGPDSRPRSCQLVQRREFGATPGPREVEPVAAGLLAIAKGRRHLSRWSAEALLAEVPWDRARLGESPGGDGLVMALSGHGGRDLGVLFVGDKSGGEFIEEDEAFLLQLGQITSTAIENLLFSQAHEANTLKEEFVSTLSHELRTPLTAILGWVRLLQKDQLDDHLRTRGLEVIERNVKAQGKLIDDLLDISRITAGKVRLAIQPVVLRNLLEAAIDAARPMAEAGGIALRISMTHEPVKIVGDPDRLQQVIWNLLQNAIQFTPRGGSIELALHPTAGGVAIRVRDSGRGIAPEFLPHVFERFRQGESGPARKHGGLGIGLAVVRHIVELHGGTVSAASDGLDRGATFTICLPSSFERPNVVPIVRDGEPAAQSNEASGRFDLSGLRVLVVDDEPDMLQILSEILSARGAEVRPAASAAEAMEALGTFPAEILVTDIGMPVEDGWSLMGRVRATLAGADLPAIALTAYAEEADRMRSRLAGFQLHLSKPIEPEELIAAVARMAGRAAVSADRSVVV